MATFATEIVISATLTEMAAAFASWTADWKKNHADYLSLEEHLACLPEKAGGSCASHFVRLLALRQISGVAHDTTGLIDLETALAVKQDTTGTESANASTDQVPDVGQYWGGQGGINRGLFLPTDGHPYWLIEAVNDAGEDKYGGYGHTVVGADSDHDGAANTAALLADSKTHPAAQLAAAYTADGHTDFYLPSQRERALIFANGGNVGQKGWYWTSTQYSSFSAWCQGSDGYQDWFLKNGTGRVRAVRRIQLDDLTI